MSSSSPGVASRRSGDYTAPDAALDSHDHPDARARRLRRRAHAAAGARLGCQRQAPSAMLQQISEDGGVSYTTREGGDFLHRFRVTLDRNAKQMRLEPPRPSPIPPT